MKLANKIFFCVIFFFSAFFLVCGYALISSFMEESLNREVESAIEKYQYNKFVVQADLITKGEQWFDDAIKGKDSIDNLTAGSNDSVAFFTKEKEELSSSFPKGIGFDEILFQVRENEVIYQFSKVGEKTYLLVAGMVIGNQSQIYMVTGVDISHVLNWQDKAIHTFGKAYLFAICVGSLLIYFLSVIITNPIKQLTTATKKIAGGEYGQRVQVSGKDEVGQLADNFNQMADEIEDRIEMLSDSVRQKEDFVSNFAHELKTPLTSIIGYANRIYQKDLPREEQKQAAWYIWNEGMRLEALSLKLMDLSLLRTDDFVLQEMEASALLQEICKDEDYLAKEKNVVLQCESEKAYIKAEYDLFKSMIMNFIDNSIKAGATKIVVSGRWVSDGKYRIEVEDNGCGIPEEEIKRITEAFYMVDKSRSRKLHGAGLGLSLAEKIAELHGSKLYFESDGKSGTKVSIILACQEGVENVER